MARSYVISDCDDLLFFPAIGMSITGSVKPIMLLLTWRAGIILLNCTLSRRPVLLFWICRYRLKEGLLNSNRIPFTKKAFTIGYIKEVATEAHGTAKAHHCMGLFWAGSFNAVT